MTPHEPRRLGYYATKKWVQHAVLFVVVGLIAVGLISALGDATEQAERQIVELTIRNMRTGMQRAMGEALMHQREGEMASWAGSNPVRWLDSPPAVARAPVSAASGGFVGLRIEIASSCLWVPAGRQADN